MGIKNIGVSILLIVLGGVISYSIFSKREGNNTHESRIIGHEIKKLNKIIVIEQNYSAFYTKKYNDFNPKFFDFLNKNLVLYVTAKAQVTYNMKQMKINVDSTDKKIHIISIPSPELNIFPNVEIYNMEKGFLNDFSKKDLNHAIEGGKKEIENTIKNSDIQHLAHKQLLENLKELYTMASLYNWEVVDDTSYGKEIDSEKY